MKRHLDQGIIAEYSRKIFGFSMMKTGKPHDAHDLSQEILLSLMDALDGTRDISDMDAYIHTVCCYTWSKFYKKNGKHWRNSDWDLLESEENGLKVEDEVLRSFDIQRLKKEISHLSEQHRNIVVMFYYEGKSCEEIAHTMKITNAAVRWHLFDIRKKLKEGFDMKDSPSLNPKRLWVGHDGFTGKAGQAGLSEGNLLAQNIVIACYGKPLTIEELSRNLGVAAAYLEYHIKELVYLDYLKVVNKTAYQTNFFIREPKYQLITAKYQYENIGPIAESIYTAISEKFDDIRALGFTARHLDKDFLLWSLIPLYAGMVFWEVFGNMLTKNNASRPKRKDGSEHWVVAGLEDNRWYDQCGEPKEIVEFIRKSNGNGIKGRNTELGVRSLQLDSYAGIKAGLYWREFNGTELNSLYRIKQLIDARQESNENDKLEIARLANLGYVRVSDCKPEILIPFFDKEQYTALQAIFSDIRKSLGNPFGDYIEGYAEVMDKHIPDFISKEERYFVTHSIYPQYAILFHLVDHGLLRYPTEDEVKRLATVLWRE